MPSIDLLSVALDYHKRGWNVLPVEGKRPVVSGWKQWQAQKQDVGDLNRLETYWKSATGIAVVCGPVSGNLVVIDLDGQLAVDLFYKQFPRLTRTYTVKTGRGLHLYFFQHHQYITDKAVHKIAVGDGEIAVRVQDCYVVAPPSKHPSGATYEIQSGWKIKRTALLGRVLMWMKQQKSSAEEQTIVSAPSIETPQNSLELPPGGNKPTLTESDRGKLWGEEALARELQAVSGTGKGGRNNQLYQSAVKIGSVIAGGYLDEYHVISTLKTGAKLCGLPDDEARKTIMSGLRIGMQSPRHPSNDTTPLPPAKHDVDAPSSAATPDTEDEDNHPLPYKPDEEQIATFVRHRLQGEYHYFRSSWHEYKDGVWVAIKNLDRQLTDILKAVRARRVKVTRNTINGVNFFLQTYLELPDDSVVDDYPQYINVKNGLFNLDTMRLEPHRKDVYVTTQANFEYDKDARPTVFVEWLKSMLVKVDGSFDRDLMCLVQEAMGYSLTADTRHRISFWVKGPMHSGKSTLLRALVAMMGSHHEPLDLNQLGTNRFLLARIAGKRLVTFGEADAQTRLADGMYKMLVDNGGEITADIKNRDPISFVPQCKVWWAMNNYPYIGDRSGAVHSRVVIIPFHRSIPKNQWDLDLDDKIQAELPGVFNFALAGLQRLRANKQFTEVEQSELLKADLQRDSDIYAAFYDDSQWVNPSGKTEPLPLYKAFEAWCRANGIRNYASNITIKREWERIGLQYIKGTRRNYEGVSLTDYAKRAI